MADADDTAFARPELYAEAAVRLKPVTPLTESTLADVSRASMAVVQVLAHGVASLNEEARSTRHRYAWWRDQRIVEGLTATLNILGERADAICRKEGRSA